MRPNATPGSRGRFEPVAGGRKSECGKIGKNFSQEVTAMEPKGIFTPKAPSPIGPYQQAIVVGDLLFTSGQIGIDPSTGKLVPGGVEREAERIFQSLSAILEEAGSSPAQVIKVNIFLVDLGHFSLVNSIYEKFLGDSRPARTTVQVAGLPMGAAIEVDLVARISRPRKE